MNKRLMVTDIFYSRRTEMVEKKEYKKKEAILKLEKYLESKIIVKFQGGREVVGTLKGFGKKLKSNIFQDNLQNLVLDDSWSTDGSVEFGLVVVRGTAIEAISPNEGTAQIANPFL